MLDVIRRWFDQKTMAFLDLPAGSFGRPGGDLYRFSDVRRDGDTLTLILEENHLFLALTHPDVRASDHELTLTSATAIHFRWKEFGRERWHDEILPHGTVRLWAHPPLPANE